MVDVAGIKKRKQGEEIVLSYAENLYPKGVAGIPRADSILIPASFMYRHSSKVRIVNDNEGYEDAYAMMSTASIVISTRFYTPIKDDEECRSKQIVGLIRVETQGKKEEKDA